MFYRFAPKRTFVVTFLVQKRFVFTLVNKIRDQFKREKLKHYAETNLNRKKFALKNKNCQENCYCYMILFVKLLYTNNKKNQHLFE